jgi:hypothetical protein
MPLADLGRAYIQAVLRAHQDNEAAAARASSIAVRCITSFDVRDVPYESLVGYVLST